MPEKNEDTLVKSAAEAMAELDELEKALGGDEVNEEKTDLDNLEKAIDEAEEALSKSDEEEDDDQGEDDEDEDLEKSEDDELAEELIKASEAYAELEKSVDDLGAKVETLAKSVQLLVGLNTRQAKVIASLTKSLQQQGERPLKKSGARIGVGGDREIPMAKSKSELREILEKALPTGKVPKDILSFLDAYGVEATVKRLPETTQAELGLK